jgi:hypothetical protein
MPAPSTAEDADDRASARGRKNLLLRVDPAVYDALSRWAADELRSTTAQIELLLRRALQAAGRLPANAGDMPRRGRPPRATPDHPVDTDEQK